jgi:hypothetical protein
MRVYSFNTGLMRATLVMSCLCVALSGCKTLELQSHWRDRDVFIDGKNQEWSECLTSLDDKQSLFGAINDNTFLYLVIVTANRDLQRQIMVRGLTFWFDPDGNDRHSFGIRYPLGDMRRNNRDVQEEHPADLQREQQDVTAGDLEICGPLENDRHRMTVAETAGIEAKVSTADGNLVYELKIPLAESRTHPFAIGTKAGTLLGMSIETAARKSAERAEEFGGREGRASHEGGMREGGGYPGGAGGYPGGGSYGSPQGVPQKSDALKLQLHLKLAGTSQPVDKN